MKKQSSIFNIHSSIAFWRAFESGVKNFRRHVLLHVSNATAYVGILASVLLLVGDLSVGITRSSIIAILIGIGYVLLITWFFMVGRRLFQLGHGVSKEEVNRIGGVS